MSRESVPEPLAGVLSGAHPEEPDIDPVPDHVRDAARRAFTVRDRHAQVLGLVTDTLVDGPPDAVSPRQLAFAGAGLPGQVLVTVLEDADAHRITLAVECPWEDGRVEGVTEGDEDLPAVQQAASRWAAGPLQHGLVRVVLRKGDLTLHTAWVRV